MGLGPSVPAHRGKRCEMEGSLTERCSQVALTVYLLGLSVSSSCPSPTGKCGGAGAKESRFTFDLSDVYGGFFVLSDVRPGYCYTALANGRCSNQLPQSITKMQCCCDVGRCWSPGVTVAPEMCPIRATGKSPSIYPQSISAQPPASPGAMYVLQI